MLEFLKLLRKNRNYRCTWMGQVVSEIVDNFNNIAVFALAMALTHSGLVIMGIMLSRAIPAITIGPLAGVLLDRFDRKRSRTGRCGAGIHPGAAPTSGLVVIYVQCAPDACLAIFHGRAIRDFADHRE